MQTRNKQHLEDVAGKLRELAKVAENLPDEAPTSDEKLDSTHVMNFLKFFAGNDKGV